MQTRVPLKLTILCIVSIILFLCSNPGSHAKEAPELPITWNSTGNDSLDSGLGDLYVLIVGVAKYKNPSISGLKLAAKDAKDIASFFSNHSQLFNTADVKLLINESATKASVEKELYYGLRKAGKDDTIVLFFSGHGAEDPYLPGKFFFLTYDSDPENLQATAVRMSGLEFLKALDARRVVLMADSCHAGGFSRMGVKSSKVALKKFLVEFSESSGKVIITSSRPDQVSLEMPGIDNSVFTHFLLQGLKGASDKDQDGIVTLDETYHYVYGQTVKQTKGVQHPQLEGSLVGKFPLAVRSDANINLASIKESLAAEKEYKETGATLILKTSAPGIIASIAEKELGKSGPDGLIIIENIPVDKELEIRLQGQGSKEKNLQVKIPKSHQGGVYKHPQKVILRPADRSAPSGPIAKRLIERPRLNLSGLMDTNQSRQNILNDVIALECQGHEKGNKWLRADPLNGTVSLSRRKGGPASGSLWFIKRFGNDIIGLQCLRSSRRGGRWLDGKTMQGEVGLAPHPDKPYTGAKWKVMKLGPGLVALECQGHGQGPKWLDGITRSGKVKLAPTTKGKYTGTKWRIHVERPPRRILKALQKRMESIGHH